MKIDNNFLAISKCMFQDRNKWIYVTDDQKSEFFFIFNRYFSKKYPEFSQKLNNKNQDKVIGMDLWFHFMKDKPYPKWFWSKSTKSEKNNISDNDIDLICKKFNIKIDEIDFLLKFYEKEVKDELKYIKESNKNK